jgi:hypothetical protein
LPGLTRQSILLRRLLAKRMDPRVKPAGDESGKVATRPWPIRASERAVQ